jgi:site-specific recombinase XerD
MERTAAAVDQYCSGNQSRLTKSTIERYRYTIISFFATIQREYDEVRADDIQRFEQELTNRGVQERNIKKELVRLRSFYRHCAESGLVETSPFFSGEPERCPERTAAIVDRYFSDNPYGFAQSTISGKQNTIKRFFALCQKEYDEIEAEDIQRWEEKQESRGNKGHTVAGELKALRRFYDYCLDRGLIKENPVCLRKMPGFWDELPEKTAGVVRQYLSDSQSRLAKGTIDDDRRILKCFLVSCRKEYEQVTAADIACWVGEQESRGTSERRIKYNLRRLQLFYNHCLERGLVGANPCVSGEPPKRCLARTAATVDQYFSDNPFGFAQSTIGTDQYFIKRFFAVCQKEFDQIKAVDVQCWMEEQKSKGIKNSKITSYLSALRKFYSYCLDRGLVGTNPCASGEPPKRCPERTAAAVKHYLADDQSGFSESTAAHRWCLLSYFFVACQKEYDQIEPDDIKRWMRERKSKGIKGSTIAGELTALRRYYDYCLDRGLIKKNPVYLKRLSPQSIWTQLPEKTGAALKQCFSDNQPGPERKTASRVRHAIKNLFDFCQKEYDQVMEYDIRLWAQECKNKGIDTGTISHYLTALRKFYGSCLDRSLVGADPFYLKRPYPQIGMEKTAAAVKQYLADDQSGLSQYTVSSKERFFRRFFATCQKEFNQIRAADIQRWVEEQKSRGIEEPVIEEDLAMLRAFYRYFRDRGLLKNLPLKGEPPKRRVTVRIQSELPEKTAAVLSQYLFDSEPRVDILTISRRRRTLKYFFAVCQKEYDEVKPDDIQRWVEERKSRGIGEATIEGDLSCLKSFYYYCLKKGLAGENPVLNGTPPLLEKPAFEGLEKTAAAVKQYFLDNLRVAKGTIKTQQSSLKGFFASCQKEYDQVEAADIRSWVGERRSRGNKNSTIRRGLVELGLFYDSCLKDGLVGENPVLKVKLPRREEHLPVYLEKSELAELRETARVRFRERTIVETLYATGVRADELCQLKKEDVSWNEELITVWMGKGMKSRIIPFTAECGERLKMYLASRHDDSPYLFVNKWGKQLTPGTLWFYFQDISRRLGWRVHPHLMRHTFAMHLALKGTPLEAIKKFMGHENIKTTEIYTKLSAKVRKEMYDKFS